MCSLQVANYLGSQFVANLAGRIDAAHKTVGRIGEFTNHSFGFQLKKRARGTQ